jgi:hypothetical protein
MAADYSRQETTTTVVRLKARPGRLDGTADIYYLLHLARQEVNRDLGNPDLDQDPGYGLVWLEPYGSEGEDDAGVAVCFEKSTTKEER